MGYTSTLSGTLHLSRSSLEFMKAIPFSADDSETSIYDYLWQPAYSDNSLSIDLYRNIYQNIQLFNILATLKDIEGEDSLTLYGETYNFWNHSWTISFKPGFWKAVPGPIESMCGLNFGCTVDIDRWIRATPLAQSLYIDKKAEEVIIKLSDNKSYKIPFWVIYCEVEQFEFIDHENSPYQLDDGGASIIFPELNALTIETEKLFRHDFSDEIVLV